MKNSMLLLFLTVMLTSVKGQERVQPGRLYQAGERIVSPKYGFNAVIPEGWSGFLPQGTEIFALQKNDGTGGQVLVFARENSDLETLSSAWKSGMDLTSSIHIKASDIRREGDMIYADIVGEGERLNKANKALLIGRCGGFGPCVVLFMATPQQYFEPVRDEMTGLIKSGTFTEPGDASIYTEFDWGRFLSNKILVAFELQELSRQQNAIDLCADGTFSSNVRQTGWFNQGNNSYKGRNRGTWSVSSTGPQTILTLDFDDSK
ncbi:MAG: hypothetical protein P8X57_11320, partial [Cyclobacteriaceae bacterium]